MSKDSHVCLVTRPLSVTTSMANLANPVGVERRGLSGLKTISQGSTTIPVGNKLQIQSRHVFQSVEPIYQRLEKAVIQWIYPGHTVLKHLELSWAFQTVKHHHDFSNIPFHIKYHNIEPFTIYFYQTFKINCTENEQIGHLLFLLNDKVAQRASGSFREFS